MDRIGPITNEIALHCVDDTDRPMAFMATFRYHRDDPYAVWVTFHVPSGDVHWVMARNLLSRGRFAPVGEGDVLLWPTIDEYGYAMVKLDFHSPEGRLEVGARTSDVCAFLDASYVEVADGTEGNNVDLDELVESLLT